ncbi:MAG: acetate--CoA ligase family protein [Candidatus Andersenbacteria bacterium]|nr:acetate--CoA ligase family protein [Candidatus Andersenbacteria bacterium]
MLNNFFNPGSIAVIGASSNKKKLGYGMLRNILDHGYRGKVYPISLKYKKVQGMKAYSSVLDIKQRVELAVIVIPAKAVNFVLIECGKAEIKNVIIISAGFKEIGKEGSVLEKEMKEIAKKYEINILGPNCLGILDSTSNLNASFAEGMVQKGSIGFISQSGAICTGMLDWANLNNVGFSRFVSMGNKAMISEIELLEFFKTDKKTKVVLAYLESIERGEEFMKVAAELVKIKPLFIIKPGTSKASREAMRSHTGALANKEEAVRVAFDQAGIIRINNLEELFNVAKLLSRYDSLDSDKIAIITNAGGPGVISTDEIEKNGLKMAVFKKETTGILKKSLPLTANIHNPVDVIGDAKADRYETAIKALLADKNVGGIISILTPQKTTEIKKTANTLVKFSKKSSKPVLASFVGGVSVENEVKALNKSSLACYNYPSQAASSLGKLWQYEKAKKEASIYLKAIKDSKLKKNKISKKEIISNPDFIESLRILKSYNMPVVESLLARNVSEVKDLSEKIGYPVAMKIFSSKISHKTDVGGVKINVSDSSEAVNFFNETKDKLGDKLEGMIIQPMTRGTEIILGIKKDENFGHLIMFGMGGIQTEIIKDVSFRLLPIEKKEALRMIKEIKSFKILNGYRGLPKSDIDSIADSIIGLSNLICDHPEIKELDINPLMVREKGKGCVAVDIRIEV